MSGKNSSVETTVAATNSFAGKPSSPAVLSGLGAVIAEQMSLPSLRSSGQYPHVSVSIIGAIPIDDMRWNTGGIL